MCLQLRKVLVFGLIVGILTSDEVHAQSDGVFSPADGAPHLPEARDTRTLQSRLVTIDFGQLETARATITLRTRKSATLTLNLFDDVKFTAIIEHSAPTNSGFSLSGRLDGEAFGTVTLVANGTIVSGTIRTIGKIYRIRSAGNGNHLIQAIDPASLPREAEPLLPPPFVDAPVDTSSPTSPDRSAMENRSIISVIVFYTPKARDTAGGDPEITARIEEFITDTNNAYSSSGIDQEVRLVHTRLLNYSESNLRTDLRRLAGKSEDSMREVHVLRNQYAADLVHLIGQGYTKCGISYFMKNVHHNFERSAFGITRIDCDMTFAHELGHNMGLNHDRYLYTSPTNKPYTYSYGYVNNSGLDSTAPKSSRWYTIMAYNDKCEDTGIRCERILRFSNPKQTCNGDPLGLEGSANARLSLHNTRKTVAAFR